MVLSFAIFNFGSAQDTITRKTGETIICKIARVDSLDIYFSTITKNRILIHSNIPLESVTDYRYGSKLQKANYWFNIGLGAGFVGGGFGSNNADKPGAPSFGMSFSTQKKRGLVSIRFIYNKELIFLKIKPLETAWDLGVLYGKIARKSFGFVSISGGVSCVGGVRRGSFINLGEYTFHYEKQPFITLGIPLESQLFWTPSPYIGFGIYGFANFNPEKSFFGGLFCIQLGKQK